MENMVFRKSSVQLRRGIETPVVWRPMRCTDIM